MYKTPNHKNKSACRNMAAVAQVAALAGMKTVYNDECCGGSVDSVDNSYDNRFFSTPSQDVLRPHPSGFRDCASPAAKRRRYDLTPSPVHLSSPAHEQQQQTSAAVDPDKVWALPARRIIDFTSILHRTGLESDHDQQQQQAPAPAGTMPWQHRRVQELQQEATRIRSPPRLNTMFVSDPATAGGVVVRRLPSTSNLQQIVTLDVDALNPWDDVDEVDLFAPEDEFLFDD